MIEISFRQAVAAVTAVWLIARLVAGLKAGSFSIRKEIRMSAAYICLIVIIRFVYFPYLGVNGHIDDLRFDITRIIPPRGNFIPIFNAASYDGWQLNMIGNILMFVPAGLIAPFCFEKLDSVKKTVTAGALMSVFIELSQLLFYERFSDVDDVILNTFGAFIGATVYFTLKRNRDG